MTQRHMSRFAVLGAVVLVLACGEDVSAPQACPEFCPTATINQVDTTLLSAIIAGADTTFTGYVRAGDGGALQVTNGGSVPVSRAVMRFRPFADSVILNPGDTIYRTVVQVDSFRIRVSLARRTPGVTGVSLRLYRLPAATDSNVVLADVAPYFDDSTFIGTIALDDTLNNGVDSVTVPASAFPGFQGDSNTAALGIEVRAADPTYVDLGAVESGTGATLTRYVQVDSEPGNRVARSDAKEVLFDTWVFAPGAAAPAGVNVTGGIPSSRALLRTNLASVIVDSSQVVRATLLLIPTEPVIGAPGDSLQVVADGMTADFGAKSPVAFTPADSVPRFSAKPVIGSTDTLRIDITRLVQSWRQHPTQPRTMVVRVVPEGAGLGEVRFGSTNTPGFEPRIEITYIKRFGFGGLQ